ncbi:MAG: transposase, partial [Treponema sp.]|nr:transposase [Treponema sp.]
MRILKNGATYHVTSKINNDDMALFEPRFKMLFLLFVRRAKRKFHFHLWDFCIMDNHVHFSIRPG